MTEEMSGFYELDPKEIARRVLECPDDVWFPLSSFCLQFFVSQEELMRELRSGRLVASGIGDNRGGYEDIAISALEFCRWLDAGESAVARRMLRLLKNRPQPN